MIIYSLTTLFAFLHKETKSLHKNIQKTENTTHTGTQDSHKETKTVYLDSSHTQSFTLLVKKPSLSDNKTLIIKEYLSKKTSLIQKFLFFLFPYENTFLEYLNTDLENINKYIKYITEFIEDNKQ